MRWAAALKSSCGWPRWRGVEEAFAGDRRLEGWGGSPRRDLHKGEGEWQVEEDTDTTVRAHSAVLVLHLQ